MEAAFESLADLQEAFGDAFAQEAGAGAVVRVSWVPTPLGPMLGAAVDDGVCLLEYTDRRRLTAQLAALRKRFGPGVGAAEDPLVVALRAEMDAYFAGRLREFTVPLVYPGTPFEVSVWERLRRIPYGATVSYLDIAKDLGDPGAMRAVGGANGRNRIAIVIPCHRVVNEGGRGLGGYGGGLWRKERLLALERGQAALA
jgi:AraC family transcriptional regulator of adaptative response/methylated-DNA-[protein]-cysteine methyltransferase